jgi:hypothetical protein
LQVKLQNVEKGEGLVPQATLGRDGPSSQQNQTSQNRGGVPEGGHRQLFHSRESGSAGGATQMGEVSPGSCQSGGRVHAGVLFATKEHQSESAFL